MKIKNRIVTYFIILIIINLILVYLSLNLSVSLINIIDNSVCNKILDYKNIYRFLIIAIIFSSLSFFISKLINNLAIDSEFLIYQKYINAISRKNINEEHVISVLSSQQLQIKKFILNYLKDFVYQPLFIIGLSVVLISINIHMSILIISNFIFTIFLSYYNGKKIGSIFVESNSLNEKKYEMQNSIIMNLQSIFIYNKNDYFINKNIEVVNNLEKSQKISIYKKSKNYFFSLIIEYGPTILYIFYGSFLLNSSKISIGQFVGVFNLIVINSLPISKYSNSFLEFIKSIKVYKIIYKDVNVEKYETINKYLPDLNKDFLKITDLSFSYGDNVIFDKLNFSINNSDIVGITGESGIGKTTLLKIILGLEIEYEGKIEWQGNDIRNISIEDIWNLISYVDQNKYMFDGIIGYNIAFDNYKNNSDLEKMVEELNFGNLLLSKCIKNNGNNLSGGEKEKISFARALFKQGKILILDEPTSNLDIQSEKIIMNYICSNATIPIIIISHREETLKYCNKIYKIENNKIGRI